MRSCWKANPKSRPTFAELNCQLDDLLSTVTTTEYLNICDLTDSDLPNTIIPEDDLDHFEYEK